MSAASVCCDLGCLFNSVVIEVLLTCVRNSADQTTKSCFLGVIVSLKRHLTKWKPLIFLRPCLKVWGKQLLSQQYLKTQRRPSRSPWGPLILRLSTLLVTSYKLHGVIPVLCMLAHHCAESGACSRLAADQTCRHESCNSALSDYLQIKNNNPTEELKVTLFSGCGGQWHDAANL